MRLKLRHRSRRTANPAVLWFLACITTVVEEKAQKAALLDKLGEKGYNWAMTGKG
jgi:hypothetical protein